MSEQTGARNPNWKGGRVVASNGYVLVKMPDHPAADSRGYVYEHRVVAEEKLGRPLCPGEQVHHVNHDKTDNRPENLDVVPDRAHHAVRHRRRGDLRRPGEPNFQVPCACECGALLWKYDEAGRPRRFISGHNPPPVASTQDAILVRLAIRPAHRADLAEATGHSLQAVAVALSKLRRAGVVVRLGRGEWALQPKAVRKTA